MARAREAARARTARGEPPSPMEQIIIFDMAGLSMWPEARGLAIFKQVVAVDGAHYPETLHRQFIINAPFIFSALWRFVRGWIDPVTASKVVILGKDYASALLEEIDPAQLPVEYGGTNPFEVERPPGTDEAGAAVAAQLTEARAALAAIGARHAHVREKAALAAPPPLATHTPKATSSSIRPSHTAVSRRRQIRSWSTRSSMTSIPFALTRASTSTT